VRCSIHLVAHLDYLLLDDCGLVSISHLDLLLVSVSAAWIRSQVFDLPAHDTLRHLSDSTWLHVVKNDARDFIEVILAPPVGVLSGCGSSHRLANANEATGGALVVGVLPSSYKLVDFVLTGHIVHHGWLVVRGPHTVTAASLSPERLLQHIFGLVQHANLLNSIHGVGDLGGGWSLGTLGRGLLESPGMLFGSHLIEGLLGEA
jgi:hypothetical protein